MPKPIIIEDYNDQWPCYFIDIREILDEVLYGLGYCIEHVGSTSVPGLPAKAVIDMDIIPANFEEAGVFIHRLGGLGYEHRGTLGIAGREAFKLSDDLVPEKYQLLSRLSHHLYLCDAEGISVKNHLTLRNHLRQDAHDRRRYGVLKRELAALYPLDIDCYIAHKTAFITDILSRHGFDNSSLNEIIQANGSVKG